jgi:hypothetical protein
MDPTPLVNYLRAEILKCAEVLADEKRESKNGSEMSKGYWSGKSNECYTILSKLVNEWGVTFEPDINLIIEAETLIPKGAFWCGHELNRSLHHYRASFKSKNYPPSCFG